MTTFNEIFYFTIKHNYIGTVKPLKPSTLNKKKQYLFTFVFLIRPIFKFYFVLLDNNDQEKRHSMDWFIHQQFHEVKI